MTIHIKSETLGQGLTKLTDEEKDKIRTEKNNILKKYYWMQKLPEDSIFHKFDCKKKLDGLFEDETAVRSFEDIVAYVSKRSVGWDIVGNLVFGLAIDAGIIIKPTNETDKIKNRQNFNRVFIEDVERLIYLRKLVPKRK